MKWGRHNRHSIESAKARFMARVEQQPNGCWKWIGAKGGHGRYGSVGLRGKAWLAHRAAWYLFTGNDPDAMCVCHKCDNGLCVNPEHLFIGTQEDNVRDMEAKNRSNHPSCEKHGRAKLTTEQVQSIRARWPSTSMASLSKEHGVSKPTIRRIVNGTGWITK